VTGEQHADTVRRILDNDQGVRVLVHRLLLEDVLAENEFLKEQLEAQTQNAEHYLSENQRLRDAARAAMNELGVPQPGYLQPVANAYEILAEALRGGDAT
jgi:hypothetical protein